MGKQVLLLAIGLVVATGCFGGRPTRPTEGTDGRPTYDNVSLTIACSDRTLVEALSPVTVGWAARTKARVTFVSDFESADIAVQPPPLFGAEAARGAWLPVPDDIMQAGHAIRWPSLNYPEKVMSWGRQVQGIILGAGADVLLYRTDVLRGGRALTAAATWEELFEQAEALSRDANHQPVLPPLPADDATLLHQFHLIAAGFDRQAVQSEGTPSKAVALQGSTFHHDLSTGAPRIRTESFIAALTLMKRLQAFRPAGTGDVVAALKSDQAKIAVLSLADLGRLASAYQGRLPDSFAIAPMPGTRQSLDPATQRLIPAKNGINSAAYLGDQGFIGAVRKSCPHPAAAFDLLAELGGPSTSLSLIANPVLGFGPWRQEQTDSARRDIWNGYGLGPTQMSKLILAVKVPFAGTFANPVVAPRGPDTGPLMEVLASHVRQCLMGTVTPEATLANVDAEWTRIDSKFPAGDPLKWRRESAGLPAR